MELDKERLEIVRGEVSFGRNLVIYYFCNSRCPPIMCGSKIESGKRLSLWRQKLGDYNPNENDNKYKSKHAQQTSYYHFTGDIFKPSICSSPSKKEQEQSLLALPWTLN